MPQAYRLGTIGETSTEVSREPFEYLVGVARVTVETLMADVIGAHTIIDVEVERLRQDLYREWDRTYARLVPVTMNAAQERDPSGGFWKYEDP